MKNKIIEKIKKRMIYGEGDQELELSNKGKKNLNSKLSGVYGAEKKLKDKIGNTLGVNAKVLNRIEKIYK